MTRWQVAVFWVVVALIVAAEVVGGRWRLLERAIADGLIPAAGFLLAVSHLILWTIFRTQDTQIGRSAGWFMLTKAAMWGCFVVGLLRFGPVLALILWALLWTTVWFIAEVADRYVLAGRTWRAFARDLGGRARGKGAGR